MNISVDFEKVVHPQLYKWISKFIHVSQSGFCRRVGSSEYGCTLLFKMLSVLERRSEGILISLDVTGVFDRVWWAMLLAKFMPPDDTTALICLSFTNACVVSTIIIFRCGLMAPPHSKGLGLKHVIVHFHNDFTQCQVVHNMYECDREFILAKH